MRHKTSFTKPNPNAKSNIIDVYSHHLIIVCHLMSERDVLWYVCVCVCVCVRVSCMRCVRVSCMRCVRCVRHKQHITTIIFNE